MNCANCGGAMKPVGNRSYFRCPYCETFHFPDTTGDGVAEVQGDTPHLCPICEVSLVNAAIDGHPVGYCRTCRGFLATNTVFGQAVQHKRANPRAEPPVPVSFDSAELNRRVNCPGCRKPMDTHPYHAGGNAVLDTCSRCRLVWLDAGELTVIGSYRRAAGPADVRSAASPEVLPTVKAAPIRDDSPTPVDTIFEVLGFVIRLL